MIKYTKAIKRFRTVLREVEFDAREPNPQLAWSAFKTFAYEPVDCIRESLLVELGNFYPGENLFHLTLLREFWVIEYGEEALAEAVHRLPETVIHPAGDMPGSIQ